MKEAPHLNKRIVFHALAFTLALRQVSFIQTSSVWLKLLQYVVTFKQANAYAHPQARARRRAQLLKITIHQSFHYCNGINHFTCGNGIEFHSVLLFIDPSRLAKHFRLNKDSPAA